VIRFDLSVIICNLFGKPNKFEMPCEIGMVSVEFDQSDFLGIRSMYHRFKNHPLLITGLRIHWLS
jgi:hypothetical protein